MHDQDIVRELLSTAIDTHIHFAPGSITECAPAHSTYDICKDARDYGIRALVLKNTTFPSAWPYQFSVSNLYPLASHLNCLIHLEINKNAESIDPAFVLLYDRFGV